MEWTFVYRTVDLVTLIMHSPQSWHKKQLLRARRRLCFWQSCSWQVVKQSAVFLLGGAAVRPTPANNEFYLRAKASVGDAEAIIQDENMPGHPDEIVRQTQDFQRDITFHNRRSIHHYCLIGRNLSALKSANSLTPATCLILNYSASYRTFLMSLHRYSVHYPKVKRVTVGIRKLKTKFKAFKDGVATEKPFWRTI